MADEREVLENIESEAARVVRGYPLAAGLTSVSDGTLYVLKLGRNGACALTRAFPRSDCTAAAYDFVVFYGAARATSSWRSRARESGRVARSA